MSRSRFIEGKITIRMPLIAPAIAACALAIGCQSQPLDHKAALNPAASGTSAAPDSRSSVPAGAPVLGSSFEQSGAVDEARRLSDQAQRDLAELERLRSEIKPPPTLKSSATPPGEKTAQQSATPTILWNSSANRLAPVVEQVASTSPAGAPGSVSAIANAPQEAPHDPAATVAAAPGQTKVDRLAGLIVDLSGELYREAAYSEKPLRELLVIAATTMLNPDSRSVPADPAAIPDLTDRQREMLGLLQSFFAELGRELDGARDEQIIAAAVAKLDKALTRQPQLRLTNSTLCWRVEGFSKFDAFSRNAFMAQIDQQVIVYVEIGDFTSQENPAGEWTTRLSQQLVIYNDSDGIPVWQEDWQPAVDRTKKKRTDFFLTQVVTLPKALSVGRYQLKIRVRDDQSKAEAETSIEFEMVADQRLAASMR